MRYAVYFSPPASSPLTEAGSVWLSRNAFTGEAFAQPPVPGIESSRFKDLTDDPRRYGFHATLKPPFHLADGRTEDELVSAVSAFASARHPFEVRLAVSRLGGFLALTPPVASKDLNLLADACITRFEPFRRPLSAEEIERRRAKGLTRKQVEYLVTYGYPYLFDEFRFHMTLSVRLSGAEADVLRSAAESHFDQMLSAPVPIDTLALFVEPEPGAPFTVLATAALGGRPAQG